MHNSRGRINGGVLGMVFQGAAEATAPGYVGSDLHIHYLAGAHVGPIRTDTHVVREADDHVVCRVEAFDAGADDLRRRAGHRHPAAASDPPFFWR